MSIDKNEVEAFLFGAIGNGFNSYPSRFLDVVRVLDKGDTEYSLECNYTVKDAKTKIIYVEYGLTGVGKQNNYRKGRNFGIRIDLYGYKIKAEKQEGILKFIQDFVNHGVVKEDVGLFDVKGGVKHYKVASFDAVSSSLDVLIELLKGEFINDFGNHLEPIDQGDNFDVNLNPPLSVSEGNRSDTSYFDDTKNKMISFEKETKKEKNSERKEAFDFTILNTGLLVILIFLSIYQCSEKQNDSYSSNSNYSRKVKRLTEKNEKLKNENEDLRIRISQINSNNSKSITLKSNNDNELIHIVKRGDNLGKIVRDYNEKNKTNYTTKEIAIYNNLSAIVQGRNINYRISINQKINFPNN